MAYKFVPHDSKRPNYRKKEKDYECCLSCRVGGLAYICERLVVVCQGDLLQHDKFCKYYMICDNYRAPLGTRRIRQIRKL